MSSNTVLISLPPDRGNIKYSISPKVSLDELSNSLCMELNDMQHCFPKTILFVRRYGIIEHQLGTAITSPAGYPNLSKYRRVEMY